MVGGNATPVTFANYIGHGILVGAFFLLAEKIYLRLFKDTDPNKKMVFSQKEKNENGA
jgi:hypothetical protein